MPATKLKGLGARPFAHREPEDLEPFQEFFQAPLIFNAEQYAVAFSAKWLNRLLADTNRELLYPLREETDKLEIGLADDLVQQVRTLLRTTLVTGHATADQGAEQGVS